MLEAFALFSAFSFYGYGLSCLLSRRMVAEFTRYRLPRYRTLTGYLQILGATGLLLGIMGSPGIGFLAALGLSLQMFAGILVRIRIRDNLLQCTPALVYLCLNAFVAYRFLAA